MPLGMVPVLLGRPARPLFVERGREGGNPSQRFGAYGGSGGTETPQVVVRRELENHDLRHRRDAAAPAESANAPRIDLCPLLKFARMEFL